MAAQRTDSRDQRAGCRRRSRTPRRAATALASVLLSTCMPAGAQEMGGSSTMRGTFEGTRVNALYESPLQAALARTRAKELSAPLVGEPDTAGDAAATTDAYERLYGDDTMDDGGDNPDNTENADNGDMPDKTKATKREGGAKPTLRPVETETKMMDAKTAKTVKTNTAARGTADPMTTGELTLRTGQKASMMRAQRAQPADPQQFRDLPKEENPFEAPGIRFGSITLRPSLEQGIEATNNATATAAGTSATASVTTLRVDGTSDWRNGSLVFTGFGTWRETLSGTGNDNPQGGASFTLIEPVARDWEFRTTGKYAVQRETGTTAATFGNTIVKLPVMHDLTASASIGKTDGLLRPTFKFDAERQVFGNAVDSLGADVAQTDRNQTTLRGTFRLGYQSTPALTPFVETSYARTLRDIAVDAGGMKRGGDEIRLTAGAAWNPSEKLNGEASVGWLRHTFDDAALGAIDGPVVAAALNWSPEQGTTVTATASTAVDAATATGVNGSLVHAVTLGATREFNSRLTGTATLGAQWRDGKGGAADDTTWNAEATATWWANRYLGINGKLRYEQVTSTDPTRNTDTATLLLGLRLQR